MEDRSQLALTTGRKVYGMLLAMGVEVEEVVPEGFLLPSLVFRLRDDFSVDSDLLVLAVKVLESVRNFHEDSPEVVELSDRLLRLLLEILDAGFEREMEDHKRKKTDQPLDLNQEMLLLRYLQKVCLDEDVDGVLAKVSGALHHQDLVRRHTLDSSKEGFSDSLEYLAGRGKYRELLDFRAKHPATKLYGNAGQHIIGAHAKTACFIKFDEHGMPFSNDAIPQHPWADFKEYRRQFMEEQEVRDKLRVMRRASVAELLRKLVNKDLDYGEGSDAQSTKVGMFSGELDVRSIRMVTRELEGAFEATAVSVPELFDPLAKMLETQMEAYGKVLQQRYGAAYKILPSRVKTLESALLKMLKERKTTVGSITDLIGFTVLTDTEAQAEQVYAEIKGTMDPEDIKEALAWEKPTRRGYKSMDITGVPEGFDSRIQVQCRTKELDERNFGQFSNHAAYKVFSGQDLLTKINDMPAEYLDLLYQVLLNLRSSYEAVKQKGVVDPARIIELYSRDNSHGMGIVRTTRLY